MARRKTPPLDATLANFQDAILAISKVVKIESKDLEPGQYEIPPLINAAEKYARILTMLIDAAPFLQTRQHIEVTEQIKAAILDSPDIIGEQRQHALDTLTWYEEKVLANTGHYVPKSQQMTML